jgi:hypothetical protein
MGSIPFTGDDIIYTDSETDVEYILRQATDEVELKLQELRLKYSKDENGKTEIVFSENPKKFRDFLNDQIDTVLVGWASKNKKIKLPEFPKDHPSKNMRGSLKLDILNWWIKQGEFTKDDLKN